MMPVVRISLGRFDAANYDAVRKLLDDSQKTLIPAIGALKGDRAYYVGIDPENNAMTNVSVWDTRTDAEQMAALNGMLEEQKAVIVGGWGGHRAQLQRQEPLACISASPTAPRGRQQ
jgi:hypothetical protein